MLSKQTRPQASMASRSFFESTSSSKASDKNDTSRASQFGANSNNIPPFGSNTMSTQPFAFQYRFPHAAPQATQNNRKKVVGSGTGIGNYQYGSLNSGWTAQRTADNTCAETYLENAGEKQRIAQTNVKDTTERASYQGSNLSCTIKEKKVQEIKKESIMEEETQEVYEKVLVGKEKTTIMNEVGTALISNLASLRTELHQDLMKCKDTEEVERTFAHKVDLFDETLKKLLTSYQEFGGNLKRVEGVVEEQFEVILTQFDRSNEDIDKAREGIVKKLNTGQTNFYRKAGDIRKRVQSVKKLIKNVVTKKVQKQSRKKVDVSRHTNTNSRRVQSNQSHKSRERVKKDNVVKKSSGASRNQETKRANPWNNEVSVNEGLPRKQLKPCIKSVPVSNERRGREEMEIEMTKVSKVGMILRKRDPNNMP